MGDASGPMSHKGWACWFNWKLANGQDALAVTTIVLHSLHLFRAQHFIAWSHHTAASHGSSSHNTLSHTKIVALSAADLESLELVGDEIVWHFRSLWVLPWCTFHKSKEGLMWCSPISDGLVDSSLL